MVNGITKNFILSFLAVVIVFGLNFVFAELSFADSNKIDVEIPISLVETENADKIKDKFNFKMESVLKTSPLPRDSIVKCGYMERNSFIISFDNVGTYRYTIKQVKGNNKYISKYDDTVYNIEIIVYRKSDGNLNSIVKAIKGNSTTKPDEISFLNKVTNIEKEDGFSNDKKSGFEGIDTGDKVAIILWAVVLIVALVATVFFLVLRRRRDKE